MAHLVHDFLELSCLRYPEKTAILHGAQSYTFSQINSLSNKLAHLLLAHGLKKGDRVLVIMENSFENVASYYGILKAGGVSVEIHERSTPSEASYYIRNSGARICILSGLTAKRLDGLDIPLVVAGEPHGDDPSRRHITWGDLDSMPDSQPSVSLVEDDLAAIVYTSGSTGNPKGVTLTHKNLCSNTASIVSYLGLVETDRIMAVLPFYYVYGKNPSQYPLHGGRFGSHQQPVRLSQRSDQGDD